MGHEYVGHKYIGHNYTGHNYIGQNYIGDNARQIAKLEEGNMAAKSWEKSGEVTSKSRPSNRQTSYGLCSYGQAIQQANELWPV